MTTDIQELVTNALLGENFPEEPERQEKLTEVSTEPTHVTQIVCEGRDLEEFLATPGVDAEEVRKRVAFFGAMYVARGRDGSRYFSGAMRPVSGTTLLLMAHDYATNPDPQMLEELREIIFRNNNHMEAHYLANSVDSALSYLEQMWDEDELVSRLSSYTSVKTPTVKKWLSGSTPNSGSGGKIQTLARCLYELQAGCGMSREEALLWWDTPTPALDGVSPDEAARESASYSWKLSLEIEKAIGKLGGGIGFQ